jgi:DNA-binding response OmpR family regulator
VTDNSGSRVLVADDHPLIVSLLRRTFEEAGYHVAVEMAADRVAEAATNGRPDLAVVDAQMGPFDIFHALNSLGDLDDECRPAIIVLSGDDEPSVRRRALELGAAAFLLKPWDPDELLELGDRLIAARRATR